MRHRSIVFEIVTADMAAALAFYARLGLHVPPGAEHEPHVELELAEGVRLAFDPESTVRAMDPSWTPPTGGHRTAIAFECDGPGHVDALYAELTAAGHHGEHAPWDAFWGQRYAVVHDPDGVHVDLFAPLVAAAQPE